MLTIWRNYVRLMLLIFICSLLISCGNSKNSSETDKSASITYRLTWPVAAMTVTGAPAGVVTVRRSVFGDGMTVMSGDFPASAGTGTITNVPVGINRIITFQGLNSSSAVIYQAMVSSVTLASGQTYDCGAVNMTAVGVAAVPADPSELSTTTISFSQINLAWSDNSNNESVFKIERKTGSGGTYTQIGTAVAGSASYSDTGLTGSTTYYYRVRATNSVGDSGYTNESNATSGVAPRFTDKGNGTIYDSVSNLTWLKDANCFDFQTWDIAIAKSNNLASGQCGLSDGSNPGAWHLATIDELRTFVNARYSSVDLNKVGFLHVQGTDYYWSGSTSASFTGNAWIVNLYNLFETQGTKTNNYYVWPVHSGQ